MTVDSNMLQLFKAELELCRVGPGQVLAVLTADGMRADYASGFLAAARELGATAFHLNLPPVVGLDQLQAVGCTALTGNGPAIAALKGADIVIDLMGLLFSPEQNDITAAGARMLLVVEPLDVLRDLFPTPGLRRRVEHAEALLSKARRLHVTSPAGTDVIYELSDYPVLSEYGYTDRPGRWDHWPSGFLLTHGNDGAVEGSVTIDTGDIITCMRRYVQNPIRLRIKAGYVVSIDGDGLDARLLRSYMESFDDPRAYAVSHIGWGLNRKAQWHHLALATSRNAEIGLHGLAFDGNVLFSLGPNSELGGSNNTRCHIDIPLRGCTLVLDHQVIVREGVTVSEPMPLSVSA